MIEIGPNLKDAIEMLSVCGFLCFFAYIILRNI